MKLFHISQSENSDYDTYDSAVVCAEDEDMARNINPEDGKQMTNENWVCCWSSWCSSPDSVKVVYIGEAAPDIGPGVICSSFNAG